MAELANIPGGQQNPFHRHASLLSGVVGAEARDSARQQQRQADCHGLDGDGSDERRRSYLSACLIDEVMKGSQNFFCSVGGALLAHPGSVVVRP